MDPRSAPGGAKRGPRGAKTAPRAARSTSRAPQEQPRDAKSDPRAAKTAQRAAQERLRSGPPGHLAPNCRPRAPRRPPEGHLGALGALFSTLRGPILRTKHLTYFMKHLTHVRIMTLNLQPSGKQFRLLLGLSKARAQKPKKQKRQKPKSRQKGHPNNRWPRSARLTKVVGGVAPAAHYNIANTNTTVLLQIRIQTQLYREAEKSSRQKY